MLIYPPHHRFLILCSESVCFGSWPVYVYSYAISMSAALLACMPACVCVRISPCVCVCVYICVIVSVSVCLSCRCFVSLMRGVQGLHGGLWKIIFSCFAMKALLNVTEESHSNGGGLGWIIQHLQSILIPTSSRHLLGQQGLQARHGNVDNSLYNALSGPVATWEAVGAWIFVWVCNLVCWIIKPPKCYFIVLSKSMSIFFSLMAQRKFAVFFSETDHIVSLSSKKYTVKTCLSQSRLPVQETVCLNCSHLWQQHMQSVY